MAPTVVELLHFDHGTWSTPLKLAGETCQTRKPIVGVWGAKDQVWVYSANALARIDSDGTQVFGNWTCGFGPQLVIDRVWGSSENDVFIALHLPVEDGSVFNQACGEAYVVHYDGHAFHRI